MLFIAYIVIAIAALVMVYFGHLQGTSQFYTSILGATIVLYCVYLDFKKRREKKAEENKKNGKSVKKAQHSGKKSVKTHDISGTKKSGDIPNTI